MIIKYIDEEKNSLKHWEVKDQHLGNPYRMDWGPNRGRFGYSPYKYDETTGEQYRPRSYNGDPTIHVNYKNPSSEDVNYYRNSGTKESVNKYQYKTTDEKGREQYFYTDKGAKRYAQEESENNARSKKNKYDEETLQDTKRWVRDDYKKFADTAKQISEASKGTSNMIDMFNIPKKNGRIDLSDMTDAELNNILNREQMERKYNDYFNAAEKNKGADYAKKFFDFVSWSGQQAMTAAQIISVIRSFA